MQLPDIADYTATQYANAIEKKSVIGFKGYNANTQIEDGEMPDMLNLTSDYYPCLSPRASRAVINSSLTAPTALFAKEGKLAYVDGADFYYDGEQKGPVTAGVNDAKQMVSFQHKILIFPDKKYYDISTDTFGSLENSYISSAGEISFTTNTIVTTGDDFTGFNAGDAVTISGCTQEEDNNKTAVIVEVADSKLTFSDNAFTAASESEVVTIKRMVPDMDFICESNNRVWGCVGNDIYASKLGDPFNWNYFQGLSTDGSGNVLGKKALTVNELYDSFKPFEREFRNQQRRKLPR